MVLNHQGGCSVEVISPTSFTPKDPVFDLAIGDLGIGCTTVKTPDIRKMHEHAREILGDVCDQELVIDPLGRLTFYLRDFDNNLFQILESDKWFTNHGHPQAGLWGAQLALAI